MINFIKEQLAIWRLKRSLHSYAQPDQVFLKSTRAKFLILVQHRGGVTIRAKHPKSWKYTTIAIVTVLSLTSGIAVFADASNVPVTHPLYNLKRMSEQVRLDLSSLDQQIELHKIFAQRRLEEVSELKAGQDDHPIPRGFQDRIDGLNKDFQNEADDGLNQAKNPQVRAEARVKFCHDILSTIQSRPHSNQLPVQMVDHIKTRCSETLKIQAN